jgi:translation initiation factor IF-2
MPIASPRLAQAAIDGGTRTGEKPSMTDENEVKATSKLTLGGGRLDLKSKRDAAGQVAQVRQKFSHGRSNVVTVEVKKPPRRTGPGGAVSSAPSPAPAPAPVAPAPVPAPSARTLRAVQPAGTVPPAPQPGPSGSGSSRGVVLRTLTSEEREARSRALVEAAKEDVVRRQRAAEEATRRAAEDGARRKAEDEARRRAAEEEARKKAEDDARRKAEEQLQKRLEKAAGSGGSSPQMQELMSGDAPATAPPRRPAMSPTPRPAGASTRPAPRPAGTPLRRAGPTPPGRKQLAPGRRGDPKRRTDKVDVFKAMQDEDLVRARSAAAARRAIERERRRQAGHDDDQKVYREVVVPEAITVQELASRMAERSADVIKTLMKMGMMATINQTLDADTAELVVTEMGHAPRRVSEADIEIGMAGAEDEAGALLPRPPVVTIMGHVDHGKTSLLDALRQTDVAAHEAGGITQHIGAYQVTLPSQQRITFLDTPGHEAFTAMRARGAQVTDIVVLVVAADDGVMPQTQEAIVHAKAAKVPMIVAINKVDKAGADPQKVRQALLQYEVQVEEFGGEVQSVEVSATKKTNLDKLEEAILLQAEVLDLKANPDRFADGVVVEAKLEQGRGSVATVLVQRGTLRPGDVFVAGSEWGRVRRLIDDRGNSTEAAGPATPVEVLGLQGTPSAGDEFQVVESEARAREIAEFRARRKRQAEMAGAGRTSLEDMLKGIREGSAKELAVVIKADVQGSVEAIGGALGKLSTDKVAIRVLHSGVGAINESDVTLARASQALIIGFNVRANPQAREMARRDKVEIRYYSIIYQVTDDARALMSGMLDPTYKETFIGNAEIREVFRITKVGNVAGCMVTEGQVRRGNKVRLLRDGVVVHEGSLKTLKRFKDEVREVNTGFECGMAFDNYDDIKVGDVIECFDVETVRPTL